MAEAPLVSCLCVTRNRVPLLRRAVACFLRQTYRPRELLVLHDSDDAATRDYLAGLGEPLVRGMEVASAAPLPLGTLRNLSLQAARGSYIAQWDDDDWHAPTRLADQMRTIAEAGRQSCALLRWTIFDAQTRTAFLSGKRAWEGSLVAERSSVPPYLEQPRGEDTAAIASMYDQGKLTLLDHPYLYIYVYHGANVWDREHWQGLMSLAEPLSPEMSARVASILDADAGPEAADGPGTDGG